MRVVILALIICQIYSCGIADKKKIIKAQTIEKGMTMPEVSAIMGKPSDTLPGYFDKSKIMFFYNLSSYSSEDIMIYFDPQSKVVTNISLPKGYSE